MCSKSKFVGLGKGVNLLCRKCPVLSEPPLPLQTSPQNEFIKVTFLAVCGRSRNKTFACTEASELIKIGGQRHTLYIVVSFILFKLYYFRNAFPSFWCFLLRVRAKAFNNHFPDIWKPLMNHSRFSFQMKIQRRSEKHCNQETIYEPIEFLKFCSQRGAANCFNFMLACMTSSHHSEDQISLNRKRTVILYQLCLGWSQKCHFLQEDNGIFLQFCYLSQTGIENQRLLGTSYSSKVLSRYRANIGKEHTTVVNHYYLILLFLNIQWSVKLASLG